MSIGTVLVVLALVAFLVAAVLSVPRLAPGFALMFVAIGLALGTLAQLLGAG